MKRGGANSSGSAVFSNHAWGEIARSLGLSGRELQIVRGIFADGTEAAIASELDISPHTVHTYVERLHRKLRVVDRVELVVRITREFLHLTGSPEGRLAPICARRNNGGCPLEGRR